MPTFLSDCFKMFHSLTIIKEGWLFISVTFHAILSDARAGFCPLRQKGASLFSCPLAYNFAKCRPNFTFYTPWISCKFAITHRSLNVSLQYSENYAAPSWATCPTQRFCTILAVCTKNMFCASRFNWTTPVRHLLGSSFKLYDEQLTTQTTLEDILSHRTGIPDYFLLLLAGYPYHITRKQLIQYVFAMISLYNKHAN